MVSYGQIKAFIEDNRSCFSEEYEYYKYIDDIICAFDRYSYTSKSEYYQELFRQKIEDVEGFQRENGLTDVDKKEVAKYIWTSGKDRFSYWEKRIVSINEQAVDYYHQQLIAKKDKVQHILDEWGLSDEIIEQNKIGLADDDNNHVKLTVYLVDKGFSFRQIAVSRLIKADGKDPEGATFYADVFYGRIVFPVFAKSGEPVTFAGRTYLNDRNEEVCLWLPATPLFSQKEKNIFKKLFDEKSATVSATDIGSVSKLLSL